MAGATGVSRLQVRNVPESAGGRADHGGVSYLLDVLAAFLVPDLGTQIHGFLAIPPTIAEIWMLAYLLVKGVKVPAVVLASL